MARAFCPKCGNFSFSYDPSVEIYRCYSVKCVFVDKERKYGEGLSDNPFSKRDSSELEDMVSSEKRTRT